MTVRVPPSKAVEADTVRLCEVQILTICTMAGSILGDASLPVLHKYISCGLQKQLVSGNWYLPLTPRCNSGWA